MVTSIINFTEKQIEAEIPRSSPNRRQQEAMNVAIRPKLANLGGNDNAQRARQSISTATILDPCCGGRMMWFDRQDQRALFGDIRSEQHTLCDGRVFSITPDLNMDFRAMPFADESFRLVAFDPPHLRRAGLASWLRAKYGILGDDWQDDLRRGFAECFRVLKPEGILIFKWAEIQVPVSQILALTHHKPLFGHKSGKREKTHWLAFLKPAATANDEAVP